VLRILKTTPPRPPAEIEKRFRPVKKQNHRRKTPTKSALPQEKERPFTTRADRIDTGRIKIPNTIATMTPSRPWHRNTTARLRGFKPSWVKAMDAMGHGFSDG